MVPFPYKDLIIANNITLTIFEIENLTDAVKSILDANFVSICEGNSGSSLQTAKKEVVTLYKSKMKKNNNWIMGATAEFFIHLYIALTGFKQECLFLNLEERSIKKGFDGFYSKNNIEWLMESKSGSIKTKGICHAGKIKEAMKDLQDKVSGKYKNNNPWKNAYSHASHYDVGTSKQIRKNIKKLSDDFINNKFYRIDEFNTVPCASIFLSGIWTPPKYEDIKNEIIEITSILKGKNIHVICVTHKSVDLFLQYIGLKG